MLQARVLAPEEWPRLVGTEAELLQHCHPNAEIKALVVEDGSTIVGTWLLLPIVHLEGMWIHPDHRSSSAVARMLLREMQKITAEFGIDAALTGSKTDEVTNMLRRLGARELTDIRHWVLPMGRMMRCQPSRS